MSKCKRADVVGRATIPRHDYQAYQAYINSAAWRQVRERYWASRLPKDCWCCGTERRPGFHLHHRTYKNLGAERLMDLVPVCPDCHEAIHKFYREAPPELRRRGLWFATKVIRNRRGGKRRERERMAEAFAAKGKPLPPKFIERYGEDGSGRGSICRRG